MNHHVEPEFDEPTVVARRPIGPSRNANVRKPPAGGARVVDPVAAANPKPEDGLAAARPAAGKENFQPSLTVPVPDEPKSADDVLTAAATALLVVVAHLRGSVQQADVDVLRKEIVDQIRRFEERAIRFGAKGNDVSAARYALCSLLDETVMTTPWGSSSSWSSNSLLLEFHSETWGGEKFFAILDRVRSDPQSHLALLKLLDFCLLLGFEGKYRVLDNGRERLNDLRLDLGRLLRQHGKQPRRELSPAWRGVETTERLRRFVPLWVVFAVTAILIFSSYGLIKWRVSSETAPAANALNAIGQP